MQGSNGYPAITDLYLYAIPRIWEACPDCIILIEGGCHIVVGMLPAHPWPPTAFCNAVAKRQRCYFGMTLPLAKCT